MKDHHPSKLDIFAGSSFTSLCSSLTGSQPLKFEWFKNEVPVQDERFKVLSLDIMSTLSIAKVDTSDADNYTCIVRNAFGSDSVSTVLNIKGILFFIARMNIL